MSPSSPKGAGLPRSRIFDLGVRVTLQTIVLVSLFLLVAGHNQPGGGFAGGLVAGAGLVLAAVARGSEASGRLLRVAPEALLGLGLLLATSTGVVAMLVRGAFLESGKHVLDLPVFGHTTVSSALAFDTGVYLLVLGLVGLVLERLGGGAEA